VEEVLETYKKGKISKKEASRAIRDLAQEVSETYRKMQDERKMFQALWMADKMQRPQAQGPRRELARGLSELRMSRYRDLAGQAAQVRARDLVEEIFDGVTEEEQELTS
jgi:polyhydroxyalkanoate synthesis regulator phasin